MHDCLHCGGRFKSDQYVSHVKNCIANVLRSRTAAEASARYFASVYRQARFERKTPQLLIRRYE